MMEYGRFVRLRGGRWDDFEARIKSLRARRGFQGRNHQDLETLAFQYRQILHDHAQASARYPETAAARRLNRLALDGTHSLHWDRGSRAAGVGHFFSTTFPRAFRRNLPVLGVAAALFVTALLFGLNIAIVQPGMGLGLLGPRAIEGLREGHLWTESLVSTVPPAVSSSSIATNNMGVALTGWAGGALAGLGSLYVILLNGFLLGAIVGVTIHYSLARRLLEFVSAHGPLEITLILVTASAGLALGRALVAAQDRPRAEVLGDAGRDALILLGGCLPWFLLLGIVEGVLSPSPAIPASLKLALGLVLEATFLTLAMNPTLRKG